MNSWAQFTLYLVILTFAAIPLGAYMAKIYAGEISFAAPLERAWYRIAGIQPDAQMSWQRYAGGVLLFNLFGFLLVYLLQRSQGLLPLNPAGLGAIPPELALNTAISFATNTNWQSYGGETTMSSLTQMLALTVQNFVSAGTGMAVLVALIRGMTRSHAAGIGNFWVDLTRSVFYVLLPLSIVVALLLVSQGVVQNFGDSVKAADEQLIAVGPAASQVAIKQLGTNGGGFFNVNSAHPLENPTPLSNFIEVVSILLIPAALCFMAGRLLNDKRQGRAIYAAMLLIFIPLLGVTLWAESQPNPLFASMGIDQSLGNLEGKETRFGVTNSALWAVATTAASNGSVNSMHDSFMPLGGMVAMWLMQLGEIVFGGIGSGLYGMLVFVIITVFICGLMVGRTPEYLGKKIDAREMKMASLVILLPASTVLIGTAIACVLPAGTSVLGNPSIHGFSEILYAFSSASNNNGSAFGGLTASGVFYSVALGICMLVGRYWVIVPILAIAGSLAAKKAAPASAGTLPTHTPLFVVLLVGVIALVGALTFIPALALGPIVEHLELFR